MKDLQRLLFELDMIVSMTNKKDYYLIIIESDNIKLYRGIERIAKVNSIKKIKNIVKDNIKECYKEYELSYSLINLHFSDYISDFIKKETSNDRIEVSFNYEINNDTLSMFITLENYLGSIETLTYKTELKGEKYIFDDPYFVANSLIFLTDCFSSIKYTFLDDFLNLDI